MKIYTKSGDHGTTSMIDGSRIKKNSIVMNAVGDIDELNSSIGLFVDDLSDINKPIVLFVMNKLFDIGSIICSVGYENFAIPTVEEEHIIKLEQEIDRLTSLLPALKNFILPSGKIHYSRAVCRRSERSILEIESDRYLIVVKFINRLSDYLFTLARYENIANKKEILWIPEFSKKDI